MFDFRNDYTYTCHPKVLEALAVVSEEPLAPYGDDPYTAECTEVIRKLCATPEALVSLFVGGTSTNLTALSALLRPWESIIAPASGHINTHEVGALEATGHKILEVPTGADGKLYPAQILDKVHACEDEHLTRPALVFISNLTENGALYSKAELTTLSYCCKSNGLLLYLDGARLGAALAAPRSDLTFPDVAALCDAFYIGGAKNGMMMGEALVVPDAKLLPDFFRAKKQRGAVLEKNWLIAVQFLALLKDGLYLKLARHSVDMAQYLQGGLKNLGIPMYTEGAGNQIFPILPNRYLPSLSDICAFETWGAADEEHTVIRLVCSFKTGVAEIDAFLAAVRNLA